MKLRIYQSITKYVPCFGSIFMCHLLLTTVVVRRKCRRVNLLVLTQKEGEILQVGDDVTIHIKRIGSSWVRLCIDAPRDIELQRISAEDAKEQLSAQKDLSDIE